MQQTEFNQYSSNPNSVRWQYPLCEVSWGDGEGIWAENAGLSGGSAELPQGWRECLGTSGTLRYFGRAGTVQGGGDDMTQPSMSELGSRDFCQETLGDRPFQVRKAEVSQSSVILRGRG